MINYNLIDLLLCSDREYKINCIIATTYSLELETLLSLIVNLYFEDGEIGEEKNEVVELTSINEFEKKIKVFYDVSQLKNTKQCSAIYSLIENCVCPVRPSSNAVLVSSSFHPKFWLIEYINKSGEFKYKIIISSKNITSSNFLEFGTFFESKKTEKNDNNAELTQFLEYLFKNLSVDKSMELQDMLNRLKEVEFVSPNNDFEFMFGYDSKHKIEKFWNNGAIKKSYVISPFISKSIIDGIAAQSKEMYLYTNDTELERVDFGKMHVNCFSQHDNENNETSICFHSKIYYFVYDKYSQVFIGSANASRNAFENNTEVMVGIKIDGEKEKFFFDNILSKEVAELFVPVEEKLNCENKREDQNVSYKLFLKAICFKGRIEEKNGKYDLLVSANGEKSSINSYEDKIAISLYNSNSETIETTINQINDFDFKNLELEELSKFLVIEIGDVKGLAKISFDLDSERIFENRNKAIFTKQVKNKKLMAYVEYILGLVDLNTLNHTDKEKNDTTNIAEYCVEMNGLFEKMLKAKADPNEKEKLNRIFNFIEKLNKDELDDNEKELVAFLEAFK